jgi:CheY-like chemotaxis protein
MAQGHGMNRKHRETDKNVNMDFENKDGIFANCDRPAAQSGRARVRREPMVPVFFRAIAAEKKGKSVPTIKKTPASSTVLVVEDEDIVMDVNRAMLERLGYRVLGAKTGEDTIDIVKNFDGKIDIALLDVKLPDMEGGMIYPLIKKVRPDMKVIVCSGYSMDGPAQDILCAGAEDFIQKPFSFKSLSSKLQKVLGGEEKIPETVS